MKKILLAFTLFISTLSYSQNETLVSNIKEYNDAIKKAVPGTKIVLKNGVWKDVELKAFDVANPSANIFSQDLGVTSETDLLFKFKVFVDSNFLPLYSGLYSTAI